MMRAPHRPRLSRLAVGLVAAALAASALVPAVAAIPAQAAAMGEARVWNFPAYSAGGQAYATLQGSATDGTYVYYARVDKTSGPDNSGQSTALIKASLATGQVVASVDYPVGTLCDGTPLDGVASCLG
ncbi:MAG: hypothetical protein LBM66_04925, partial [Bifidobacteriaceae bacterium]|nr:hypothetical protein [Bifidobacteriaceae bacterium]